MKRFASLLLLLPLFGILATQAPGQEAKEATPEKRVFKTGWKGEVIDLPASFAPEMKLRGIEEIRFAPGMFDAKSASFFSYVFVFSVSAEQKLTPEAIRNDLLAYYRGLAKSVLAGKGVKADPAEFTFAMEKVEEVKDAPDSVAKPEAVTQYSGKLDWIEPFVTAEAQVLHFEIQSWSDPITARNYLFVCTSPKTPIEGDPTWKEMRGIRRAFAVAADKKE
jgi:hypothetical protein